ncbi:conserved hypothetical protein [Culex quinquefasciatus]|uniref:40S ribosomal protein S14 n=1 Tax=Culex quinquefasciatus TaxID=7176 RepID=B0W738_CULQU|nr:conserved hypothetical protein [Culex quinquefasciatus]|eukprot:XP_001844522.1 conserved hypothetical protein [Culex quinquefasciatus]
MRCKACINHQDYRRSTTCSSATRSYVVAIVSGFHHVQLEIVSFVRCQAIDCVEGPKNRLEEVQVFSDEIVFGVAYVYASFNDIFVHVTDLLGKLALRCYVAALYVGGKCKSLGITSLHMKLRAAGGTCTKTPGPGAQSVLGALAVRR